MSKAAERSDDVATDAARPGAASTTVDAPTHAPSHAPATTTAPPRAARRASPATLLRLQASAGNRATQRLVDPTKRDAKEQAALDAAKEDEQPAPAAATPDKASAAGTPGEPPAGGPPGDAAAPQAPAAPGGAAPPADVDPAHANAAAAPAPTERATERLAEKLDGTPALADPNKKPAAVPDAPGRVLERPPPAPEEPLADRQGQAAGPQGQEERQATEARVQEQAQPEAPAGDLTAAPVIPLAADAAAHIKQIEANATASIAQVRSQAAAKRQHVRGFFAEKRATAASFFTGSLAAVFGAVEQRRLQITGWLTARALGVQSTVQGLVTRAMQLGTTIAAMIRQGAAALTGAAAGAVTGIIGRILGFARSIPIPNIPGIRSIRNLILGAADRVASAVGRAVNAIRTFVNMAVGAVLNGLLAVMSRIGSAMVNVVTRVVAAVNRAIATISNRLGSILARIRGALLAAGAAVQAGLTRTERAAIGEIDRAEARALRDIETNRDNGRRSIDHILEFCYGGGDYPAEESTIGHMDAVASTSSKDEFESAARAAMAATVQQTANVNASVVRGLVEATSSIVGLIGRSIATWLGGIWTRVQDAYRQVVSRVSEVVNQIITRVGEAIANVINGIVAAVGRMAALLGSVLNAITGVLRAPIDRLRNAATAVFDGVRNLLRSIISRVANLLTGGSPSADTGGLTSQVDGFTPTRLASEAQMASPPVAAAIPLIALGGIVITAEMILVALMWVAIIGIVLLALYAIYLLIKRHAAKAPAVPRAPAIPRVRPRVRRRPRRRRKPLTWNPSLSYGVVTASGGMPGTLDTTAKLPAKAPLHGHHSWPKYVGGPQVQPLMSIRDTVHQNKVHPELHAVMAAAARGMGPGFVLVRNVRDLRFIAHLRGNATDRATFAAVMSGYYASLNAITDPPIPPPAYGLGIASSIGRI